MVGSGSLTGSALPSRGSIYLPFLEDQHSWFAFQDSGLGQILILRCDDSIQ